MVYKSCDLIRVSRRFRCPGRYIICKKNGVMEVQKNERSFSEICEEFGVSRPTGHKWLKRYEEYRDPIAFMDSI